MIPLEGILSFKSIYKGDTFVTIGNGAKLPISYIGTSSLHTSAKSLNLNNILHVRHLKFNLLSMNRLC